MKRRTNTGLTERRPTIDARHARHARTRACARPIQPTRSIRADDWRPPVSAERRSSLSIIGNLTGFRGLLRSGHILNSIEPRDAASSISPPKVGHEN